MKRVVMVMAGLLCLFLTGCSAAAFWLSGCGGPDADLVVINGGSQAVWSITLDYGTQTQSIQNAGTYALLEQGQSYGLLLEEGAEQVTVVLSDRLGRELGRTEVEFSGERLYLALERRNDPYIGGDAGWSLTLCYGLFR